MKTSATPVSSIWGNACARCAAGQYWRLENLKSFDEFLERRICSQGGRLTTRCRSTSNCCRRSERAQRMWAHPRGSELAKSPVSQGERLKVQPGGTRPRQLPKEEFKRGSGKGV